MAQSRFTNFSLLPGGVENQLDSLDVILEYVSPNGCDAGDLIQRFCKKWDVSTNRANNGIRFLLQTDVLRRDVSAGRITWGSAGEEWMASSPNSLADRNHGGLILNIHKRIRFVLEMLHLLREPHSKSAITHEARAYFRGSITVEMKVYERESWFRSAGLVQKSGGLLSLTPEGLRLLDAGGFELDAPPPDIEYADDVGEVPAPQVTQPAARGTSAAGREEPQSVAIEPAAEPPTEPSTVMDQEHHRDAPTGPALATKLANEIREAASDSSNSRRLEQALDEAFTFLGFDTEWLSGAGKTDVLATAGLVDAEASTNAGQPWSSYVVAIDAKSSRERLHPGLVDFDTLDEHKKLHGADYSLVVGPDPKDGRMFRRAAEKGIAFLSTEDMATVVEIHGRTPLSLIIYRNLVNQPGQVSIKPIREAAQQVERGWEVAHLVCETILERARDARPMMASEVLFAIPRESIDQFQPHLSEAEVEAAVATLSSQFVGALIATDEADGTPRYALSMPPAVVRQRLEQLGAHVAPD